MHIKLSIDLDESALGLCALTTPGIIRRIAERVKELENGLQQDLRLGVNVNLEVQGTGIGPSVKKSLPVTDTPYPADVDLLADDAKRGE